MQAAPADLYSADCDGKQREFQPEPGGTGHAGAGVGKILQRGQGVCDHAAADAGVSLCSAAFCEGNRSGFRQGLE